MDFESLAFGATRHPTAAMVVSSGAPSCSRTYCPACQEDCVPEENNVSTTGGQQDGDLICPTCGTRTTSRPPGQNNVQPSTAHQRRTSREVSSTSTSSSSSATPTATTITITRTARESLPNVADTRQLRAERTHGNASTAATGTGTEAAPLGRQGIQERRAAVRDRVAQEVLAFIAAIEREDAATAEGFPPPPGAAAHAGNTAVNFLEGLRGFGAVGGGGGGGPGSGGGAPASQKAIERLPRIEVGENSWVLHQTVLRLTGPSELSIEALFAPFSPPPVESVFGKIVLAKPPTAHEDFENQADVRGSVLVVDRGVCTFASKALRAQAAGAAAAVVVQTHDVWPYVMEDSKGEAKAGGGLDIPVCMVSKEKGQAIKDALKTAKEGNGEPVRAELSVSSSEKDCIVCQELFAVGATLVRLPCGHLYHEACLMKWLKLSNTCPYCRRELPTSNADAERERRRREAAGSRDGAWLQFWD